MSESRPYLVEIHTKAVDGRKILFHRTYKTRAGMEKRARALASEISSEQTLHIGTFRGFYWSLQRWEDFKKTARNYHE